MGASEWFRWAAAFVLGALSIVAIEFGRGQFERRQRREDRRDDYQRETLLDLQDALIRLGSATARVHMLIERSQPVPDDLDEALRFVSLETSKLVVRVTDGRARDLAFAFLEAETHVKNATPSSDHDALRGRLISDLEAVNSRIGELLRKL